MECPGLHTYLCLDSFDVFAEEDTEESGHSDKELWHHIAAGPAMISPPAAGSAALPVNPSRQEMDEYGDNALKKLEPCCIRGAGAGNWRRVRYHHVRIALKSDSITARTFPQ